MLSTAMVAIAATACAGTQLDVDPMFDGVWTVTRLAVEGNETATEPPGLAIEIDTAELAVRGRTGCGRLFGSYTLSASDDNDREGPASFTIPSRAPDDSCPTADLNRHETLVLALESVNRWRREGPLLLLEDRTTVVELRPAG